MSPRYARGRSRIGRSGVTRGSPGRSLAATRGAAAQPHHHHGDPTDRDEGPGHGPERLAAHRAAAEPADALRRPHEADEHADESERGQERALSHGSILAAAAAVA